jgi:geranylgeranyl diphosphate synthase, type II
VKSDFIRRNIPLSTLPTTETTELDVAAAAVRPQRTKSPKRKTSHLKLVPETRELRERLKARCREIAAKMDKETPLSKDQMEVVARRLLDEMNLPEGYVGWIMVVLSSAFWEDQVAAVPPSRRLFLLPHCLKHAEGCPADYDEFGMNCKKCGACSIADYRSIAEEMGYKVLVAEGSPVVLKIIVSGYVDAIVGVACLNVLEKAIDKILLAGIPCLAVPLLSSDCRNTSVDEEWVREMLTTAHQQPAQQTRSYVHLLRASSEMFRSPLMDELVPRQRGTAVLSDDQQDPLKAIDPIAATEAIGMDFLSKGGKYSRPFITLAAYDAMMGGDGTLADGANTIKSFPLSVYRSAMSIEMFHKASLVHDDIEDDDGYRYGQPTMHCRFGLPTAINVGDYLIGLGYRLVSHHARDIGPAAAVDILDCLSSAHTRLAEGQGAELLWRDARDKRLQPLDALKVYALKTSPAFEAALYSGIRLAADKLSFDMGQYVEPVRQFSRNLGVAFQILNDLQDWDGDGHNKLHAAGDVLGGRPTILWALALASLSPEDQAAMLATIDNKELPPAVRVAKIRQFYDKARVFEQSQRLVEKHRARAEEVAESIAPEALQRLLYYLIDTVLHRDEAAPANLVAFQPKLTITTR